MGAAALSPTRQTKWSVAEMALVFDRAWGYRNWRYRSADIIRLMKTLEQMGLIHVETGFLGRIKSYALTGLSLEILDSAEQAALQEAVSEQSVPISIFAAIDANDLDGVAACAKRRDMLQAVDQEGATPLHRAAGNGNAQLVQLLLQGGADPNATDRYGRLAIRAAIEDGDVTTVEIFLNAGVGINGRRRGKDLLFDVGVNINEKDADQEDGFGETLMHMAVGNRNCALVAHLLAHGANPHVTDDCGSTLLMRAASRGDVELARLFLDLGVDVNAVDFEDKQTALHLAAEHGDLAMIALLVERGAHVNAEDEMGDTPLGYATLCKQGEAIVLLRKLGAVDTDEETEDETEHE